MIHTPFSTAFYHSQTNITFISRLCVVHAVSHLCLIVATIMCEPAVVNLPASRKLDVIQVPPRRCHTDIEVSWRFPMVLRGGDIFGP